MNLVHLPRSTAILQALCLAGFVHLAGCSKAPPAPEHADLVLLGASIETMDPGTPRASALAARDGRLTYVGNDEGAAVWIGDSTNVIRAEGATVLPGLIDTHIHAAEGALTLGECSLDDEELTVSEAGEVIRKCLEGDDSQGWLLVTRVNGAGFKADRTSLDAIIADRPLLLWGSDGHAGWVNSKGLAAAGIDRNTQDPDDGRIERDASGEPTGFLIDGAVGLAMSQLEQPTPEKRIAAISDIVRQLNAAGITAYLEANTPEETVAAYAELARRNELTARVSIALRSEGVDTDEEFARLEKVRSSVTGLPLVRADFIKLFADGVMEYPTQTAAMLEPYNTAAGKPGDSRGRLYIEPPVMQSFIQRASDAGFNIHVHAIGDAAVRETLDAFAAARDAGSKQIFSMGHLQLIDPGDLPRFAKLDVFASLQLLWAQPDNYTLEALQPYIGEKRHRLLYPAQSLLKHGATITGGSDWDVSSFNPFEAMATAISRANPDEPARGTLNEMEALTLQQILRAYTIDAARMLGRDQEIGSLIVGKAADFIVLDRRLAEGTTPEDVRATQVRHTFVNGKEIEKTE